jgi:hypothetical protein
MLWGRELSPMSATTSCVYGNMIVFSAMSASTNCVYGNMIKFSAMSASTNCVYGSIIKFSALSASTSCVYGNMIKFSATSVHTDCDICVTVHIWWYINRFLSNSQIIDWRHFAGVSPSRLLLTVLSIKMFHEAQFSGPL